MLALAAPLLSSSNWRCVLVSYTRINVPWETAETLTQLYMYIYIYILYMYTVQAQAIYMYIHVHTCTYESTTCMSSAAKGQGTMYESSCTYTGRLFMYMHAYVADISVLLNYWSISLLETMTYWDAWQLAGKCFYRSSFGVHGVLCYHNRHCGAGRHCGWDGSWFNKPAHPRLHSSTFYS